MNTHLRNFIATVITHAVLPPLMLVAAVALVTVPYSLAQQPGKVGAVQQLLDRR